MIRVTFLQTHPAQYMAPLFRHMASREEVSLTVLYASTPTAEQQGTGFGEAFTWDVNLTAGYEHRVVAPPAPDRRFDSDSFGGADVGSITEALRATSPDVVVVPGWHSTF